MTPYPRYVLLLLSDARCPRRVWAVCAPHTKSDDTSDDTHKYLHRLGGPAVEYLDTTLPARWYAYDRYAHSQTWYRHITSYTWRGFPGLTIPRNGYRTFTALTPLQELSK